MKLISRKTIINCILSFSALILFIVFMPITAQADTPGTVNDSNVNIRKSSDRTSDSLGKVNSGDKVTILEEVKNSANETWYKITTSSGITGYVKSDFITKSESTTTTTTNNNTTTTNNNNNTTTTNVTNVDAKSAYISGDVVNIRSSASATSDLVAKAQKNTEVTVNGETTAADGYKWYKVSFTADGATKTGFIRSDLLTFTKPTNNPTETSVDSKPDQKEEKTETTDTPETVDEPEVTEEPEETPTEPETPVTTEKKRTVTAMAPFEDPAVIPDGFEEGVLASGEKVWSKGDYLILYGINEEEVTGWYVLDQKNNSYISYEGFLDASSGSKKSSSDGATVFGINMKVILVVLIVIIILLLGVVFFLALKLSRGVEDDEDYEYDDYEDEEEIPVSSIENSRSSSRDRASARAEKEPKQKSKKDKFINYFTSDNDSDVDDDEYYDDVDDEDDIDFIDI